MNDINRDRRDTWSLRACTRRKLTSVMIDCSVFAVKLRASVNSFPGKNMPLLDHFEPWSRSAVIMQHMHKPLTLYTVDDNHKPTPKNSLSIPSILAIPSTLTLSNLPLCRAKTWAVSLEADQKSAHLHTMRPFRHTHHHRKAKKKWANDLLSDGESNPGLLRIVWMTSRNTDHYTIWECCVKARSDWFDETFINYLLNIPTKNFEDDSIPLICFARCAFAFNRIFAVVVEWSGLDRCGSRVKIYSRYLSQTNVKTVDRGAAV
jgi:hypothetical protein